jgi:hypothetical protein
MRTAVGAKLGASSAGRIAAALPCVTRTLAPAARPSCDHSALGNPTTGARASRVACSGAARRTSASVQ